MTILESTQTLHIEPRQTNGNAERTPKCLDKAIALWGTGISSKKPCLYLETCVDGIKSRLVALVASDKFSHTDDGSVLVFHCNSLYTLTRIRPNLSNPKAWGPCFLLLDTPGKAGRTPLEPLWKLKCRVWKSVEPIKNSLLEKPLNSHIGEYQFTS